MEKTPIGRPSLQQVKAQQKAMWQKCLAKRAEELRKAKNWSDGWSNIRTIERKGEKYGDRTPEPERPGET